MLKVRLMEVFMSKPMLKFSTITVVTIVFIYAFSASYTFNNIDNIAYVTALGIDFSEDDKNLQVTFEFMDTSAFSSNQSSESTSLIIDTVTATSIHSSINLLNAYIGKEINLAHCKVIVFSDEIASKGIFSEITELMNDIQVRPTTNLIICRSKAIDYLESSTSSLEKVLTKYYDIFPNSSEYTGYTSNITIGQFYNDLVDKHSGNLAILGGLNDPSFSSKQSSSSSSSESSSGGESSKESSSSDESSGEKIESQNNTDNVSPSSIIAGDSPIIGDRGTENIGLAVFKEDKYIGNLTAMDTLCHTLIKGEVDSFVLTIDDTNFYENYLNVELIQSTTPKIKVDISGEYPVINIDLIFTGRILGIKNSTYDSTDLDLNKISNAVENYLKSEMLRYLNKSASEFGCDIDNFYKYAKYKFLTNKEWEEFDWSSKYPKSSFNISIESNIFYNLLNSDS